jgi:hypothetical protein
VADWFLIGNNFWRGFLIYGLLLTAIKTWCELYLNVVNFLFSMRIFQLAAACSLFLGLVSCKKKSIADDPATTKLGYGDSVFYIGAQDYVISPNNTKQGTYTAFPDNLMIDNSTGNITVKMMGKAGESQTGLRYKIMFQETGSTQADSTFIVLAGINYIDRIYSLSQNDTIISPVYNADLSKQLPSGTYGISADNDLAINSTNGQINIKECIRRGLFDTPVENGEWEELTISYKSNDGSNSVTNRIDVALYYYDNVQSIPSNVSALMRAHQSQVLGVSQPFIPVTTGPVDNDLPDNVSFFKPRPPCVIIVGN